MSPSGASDPSEGDASGGIAWAATHGRGLAAHRHDRALIVDPATATSTEDLVDVLNAFDAPDPIEAIILVLERLPSLHAAVAWRVPPETLLVASDGIALDHDAAGPLVPLAACRVPGEFGLRLDDDDLAGGSPRRLVRPLSAAGSISFGRVPVSPPWITEAASRTPAERAADGVRSTAESPVPTSPPVAIVVTDDGRRFQIRGNVIIGRHPGTHPSVRDALAAPLALTDDSASMSRAHAGLLADPTGLRLVDLKAKHGTFVAHPGDGAWHRLPRGGQTLLAADDVVRVGSRWFRIEIPRED